MSSDNDRLLKYVRKDIYVCKSKKMEGSIREKLFLYLFRRKKGFAETLYNLEIDLMRCTSIPLETTLECW